MYIADVAALYCMNIKVKLTYQLPAQESKPCTDNITMIVEVSADSDEVAAMTCKKLGDCGGHCAVKQGWALDVIFFFY
jgi:hypothetical protein